MLRDVLSSKRGRFLRAVKRAKGGSEPGSVFAFGVDHALIDSGGALIAGLVFGWRRSVHLTFVTENDCPFFSAVGCCTR